MTDSPAPITVAESDDRRDTAGRYLRSFRLKQGLSLPDISRMTRIQVNTLEALEADDYAALPPKPYVKSFIHNYAGVLKINADAVINLYLAELARKARACRRKRRRQANLSMLRNILTIIGMTTSFLLLIRYTDLLPVPQPPDIPETAPPPALRPFVLDQDAIPDPPFIPAAATERQALRVVALEPTWLKVMIDGQEPRSYTLSPEDRLNLEGTRSFNLMIGSATGLRLFLNEKPVDIHGATGQIVSLKVP
ncbi:helix-turn-helix domain-containing protein [Desulfosarcina sp. OttesenSCG-928-G10]|nr:helix-turn-helix domain-containing protein [Desulfosarcina sp. OttesenSCG-928-G10]MDL2321186.1 helix-turn-helix domain-containing protein [Desulfosarcina sp. OttesenSCG-928-B08]